MSASSSPTAMAVAGISSTELDVIQLSIRCLQSRTKAVKVTVKLATVTLSKVALRAVATTVGATEA